MSKWAPSWGAWHPGTAAQTRCPTCDVFHTTNEAVALNEKDREYRTAKAWARHKEWVKG